MWKDYCSTNNLYLQQKVVYFSKKKAMRSIISVSILFGILLNCTAFSQTNQTVGDDAEYDAELAKEVGADEYGMKTYVIAFLKAGPNQNRSDAEAMELQKAHMANIKRLAKEGKLIVAGPFLDGGDLRGIYIFDVKTVEEAAALTATDPAIKAGSLVMELKPWYGSASLMITKDYHKKLQKTKF